MTTSAWLLRWDVVDEPAPRLLPPTASGSALPGASVFADRSGNLVAIDGCLFDRSELAMDGGAADAALVAAAYQRWSTGVVDKLRGQFTVALWDEGRRLLLLARDAMGLHPCFYRWDGRLLLASPSLDLLLAQPEVSVRFNRVVIAEYIRNWFPPQQAGETFYDGIERLPPAHLLRVAARTLTVSRYWDPVPRGFAWADDAELGRFLPTLERAVDRCIEAGADCLALSGGFDSVSIAAVAAGRPQQHRALHALSARFVGTEYDEGATQVAVARALDMPQTVRVFSEDGDGANFVDDALALARMSPSPPLSPWLAFYTVLVRQAGSLCLRKMMMGTGGDEMFGLDPSYGADCLAALRLGALWKFFVAIRHASAYPALRVAQAILWRNAALPVMRNLAREALERLSPASLERIRRRRRRAWASWIAPGDPALLGLLEERIAAAFPANARGEGAYVRSVRRLVQNPLVMLELEQYHAWARGLGFQVMFPYYDRDLVELTLRMHPAHLIADGRLKTPLRHLVAERVRDVSLPGKKVNYTQAFHRVFRPGGRRAWRRLGGAVMLGEMGVADSGQVNVMMERYFGGAEIDPLIPWMVLSAECWMRDRSGRLVMGASGEVVS